MSKLPAENKITRQDYKKIRSRFLSVIFLFQLIFMVISGLGFFGLYRAGGYRAFLANPLLLIIILYVMSFAIASILAFYVDKNILRPIEHLSEASKRVAKGDFSVRLPVERSSEEMFTTFSNFNDMVTGLGSIETLRDDFVANVSHEFKTPIAAIEGYAELIQDDKLSDSERREYAEKILFNTRRLSDLTSNILLLSKLENQQIITDKTSFSLDEQIRNCILLLEKQWTAKDISFDIDLQEIQYTTNAEMLSQVWVNIIGNAIKFSPEGSSIRVKLFKEGDVITAEITDRGIGMDQQTISHIFERFYQGDRAHASEGNGLGLPLVKRIVELCNGNIRVESQYGKGTNFIVTLPQNG